MLAEEQNGLCTVFLGIECNVLRASTLEYLVATSTSYTESSACIEFTFEHALFAELYSHFCKSNLMPEVKTDKKKTEELVSWGSLSKHTFFFFFFFSVNSPGKCSFSYSSVPPSRNPLLCAMNEVRNLLKYLYSLLCTCCVIAHKGVNGTVWSALA